MGKKCKTIALFIIMLSAPVSVAAQEEEIFEVCNFYHLALNGDYFKFWRNAPVEFYGVEVPYYIGYIRVVENIETRMVKDFSFVRKTDLPMYSINNLLDLAANYESVTIDVDTYKWDDKGFMDIFARCAHRLGMGTIYSESYYRVQGYPYPEKPLLEFEDFQFKETCIFEPYANPPQYCGEITLEIVNRQELVDKIISIRWP